MSKDFEVPRLIEIDARVNPGNSGGPLVNDRGEVIGTVHSKHGRSWVGRIGYAAPLELAFPLLKQIPGFDESSVGRETRHLTAMEIDAHVSPSVVKIDVWQPIEEVGITNEILLENRQAKRDQEEAKTLLKEQGIGVPEGMVLIPSGNFIMGTDIYDKADEAPAHTVYLDAYVIDKYEITNAQYQACVTSASCETPEIRSRYDNPEYANHPINPVDWLQASTYCTWAHKRLPTEAEWEKAARGIDARSWPWGNRYDGTRANASGDADGFASTAPIGSFEGGKSPYSAYDMAGNVSEWVADWYHENYYKKSIHSTLPMNNPKGPTEGTTRVIRGGSSFSDSTGLHTADRSSFRPIGRGSIVGFRCAKSIFLEKKTDN